jgi:hypothetical protein
MAVKYKEVDDKLRLSPLTRVELDIIASVEEAIDRSIVNSYKGNSVLFELHMANFSYDLHGRPRNLSEPRRKLMFQELTNRYEKAGWKLSTQIDDGLDGPNFSGPDYWVLSGKN